MSHERGMFNADQVIDKFVAPNADYEMSERDYCVRPSADPTSGAITLTLPPVAKCRGRFYSIICRDADAVNDITVADQNDSECWEGDYTLNGKCDKLLCYSDGMAWLVAASVSTYIGTTPPPTTTASPTTEAI
jgi:hypothetical protein